MIFRFENCELDDELFELRVGGVVSPLARKSFDLLRYLLLHSQRVVTKDELFSRIWSGEHVSDSVLPVTIRIIRKALGEEHSEKLIATVRGRGYRVVCAVECFDQRVPVCAPTTTTSSSFVGREDLMADLRASYEAAACGDGRVVLLFGEAGIGKTRTLDEFSRWCREIGALVLQVRCPDDPGAPPFWPIFELLRQSGELLASPAFHPAVERSGFDLERARRSILQFVQRDPTSRMDAAAARFGLIQTVLRLLERTSRIAPTVLIMDDLHCIDEGTARLCEAVVPTIPGKRVLSLSAYRHSELRRGTILAQVLGSISSRHGLQQVRLRGLDRRGIEAFVEVETGSEPSAALVDALCERTEGNPFFLRETLRLLVAHGRVDDDGVALLSRLGLAQGIRETIGRRLDTLSRECNDVLGWASVIGRRFAFPVLAQVCEVDSTRLLEQLAEAEEKQLITSAPSADRSDGLALGEFAFAHGLIRETIYEEMSGPERVLRHRAVARAIEKVHGESAGDRIFELARHFFEAAPGGDVDRAVYYALHAGRHAQLRYSNEDAVAYFDQAVHAEELRIPRDELRVCCLLLSRGYALWRAGRYARAQQELVGAATLARSLGRFDLLGYAALGLVGWPRFHQLSFGAEEPKIDRQQVCALAHEALDGLRDHNPSLCARLLAVLVRAGHGGSSHGDLALADRALLLARSSGDQRALFHSLHSKQSALLLPDHLHEALTLATEALEIAKELGGQTRLLNAYEARIPLLLMVGDMRSADADIAAAVQIADRIRSPAHLYAARRFELARALGDGQAERAKQLTLHVLELGRQVGDEGAPWATDQLTFWIAAAAGNPEVIHQSLLSIDPQLRDGGNRTALASYFYMLAGDEPRCRDHFERVACSDFTSLRRDANWLWHLCACADIAAFLRDAKRAEALYALIAPYARVNVMNRLYCYRGAAAGPLGRLAHLLGRQDEAVSLLEEAVEFNQHIGADPSRVWSECVLAAVLRDGSPRDRRRSAQLFDRVEREAARAGLAQLVEGFRASL